jgi:integrase
MATTTFVLKEPTSKEPTLIYLIFRFEKQKLKYSTGQKIKKIYWNFDDHKAKDVRAFSKAAELNTLLKNLETAVSNEYRKLLNDKVPITIEKLRLPLDEILQKRGSEVKDLIDFATNWVEITNRKPGTKKQLRQAIRILREFKQQSSRSMSFDSIDLTFYDDFIQYLLGKNYGTNTIGTLIKNLKVFMNEAVDRGLTTNLQFKNRRFKTLEEPTENIYLNVAEIKKIYELDLTQNLRLDKVRDIFIVACYTGLRFSDLVQLRSENLIDNGTKIKIKTEKTGEIVIIPLQSFIKQILIKYEGKLPDVISNQKMNQYLKELGKLSDLIEEILITSTRGGIKNIDSFKKWELVTVHTARRSFATNAYLSAVPTISIMKITGHRTEKSFMKYIKISQEDNANKLINHPFFK